MGQILSKSEIINLLANFVRGQIVEENDKCVVKITHRDSPKALHAEFSEIEKLSSRLSELNIYDETALYDDTSYEIIVREESTAPMRRLREDKIEVANEEIGIKYELSSASDEYVIWLLNGIKNDEIKNDLSVRDFRSGFYNTPKMERYLEEKEEINLIEFIRLKTFSRFSTLKISSENKQSPSYYSKLTYAFLFQISYNLDVALVPQRLLEEIVRRGRIRRMRRSRTQEIDPPRRMYNENLVQHYLLGVSTDNPVIEYLSYYHILEHFYEDVFNDDLIESVKTQLTSPGFSYKRKKDIGQLVNTIRQSFKFGSETGALKNESAALRLCLLKYVDLTELQSQLLGYDETLLEYYKTAKVKFSGGIEVDIKNGDKDVVIKALTKRIYSTRNALVHSKDGDNAKYTPFEDDRILVREVPLMRFISEMVILSASTVQ